MFRIFQEELWITVAMAAFFVLSIISKVLLGMLYQNMIREADNMASTKNRLLKQCKVKFANCYQLNHGVANIPVFVDKFLNKLSLGPVSFDVLYHISGQSMLLAVICAGIGICRSIMSGHLLGEILPFYIVSFLGLYIYFTVSTLVDVRNYRRVLKINLVDYLENHLSARIDLTEQDMDKLYGKRRKGREQGKRTVELMPIGGRLALAEGAKSAARQQYRRLQEDTERVTAAPTDTQEEQISQPQPSILSTIDEQELEDLLKDLLTV